MLLLGKEHENRIPAIFEFDMERGLTVTLRTICGGIMNLPIDRVIEVCRLLDADTDEEAFLWTSNGGEIVKEICN